MSAPLLRANTDLVASATPEPTRTCKGCETVLPESAFYSRKNAKCRECTKAARRQHWTDNREQLIPKRRAQYAADPEKFRTARRGYVARNRDEVNARQREWWEARGAENQRERRAARPEQFRDTHLRSRYGISLEQYVEMLDRQGGLCAICHEPDNPLVVDHCHATGDVRGLLCRTCNTGIGLLKDNPLLAYRAAHYLIGEVGDDGLTCQY